MQIDKTKKSKSIIYLLIAMTIMLTITIASRMIFEMNHEKILLTLYITFLTIFYHFAMRIIVGESVTLVYKNREFNYDKSWYKLHKWEKKTYKLLHVKRWKSKLITAKPEQFDLSGCSLEDIRHNMTQAEVVHEIIIVLSFVPLTFIILYGTPVVFIITSCIAALIDLPFVIIQRYNRPRVLRLIRKDIGV